MSVRRGGRTVLVLLVVGAAAVASATAAVLQARDPESPQPEPEVPADLQRSALASFAEYGRVDRVLEEAPATLHSHPGQDLWALLVQGDFEVVGPLSLDRGEVTNGRGVATAGAVVVTSSGELVRIGIWGPDARSNPVWERIFGDAYPIESD